MHCDTVALTPWAMHSAPPLGLRGSVLAEASPLRKTQWPKAEPSPAPLGSSMCAQVLPAVSGKKRMESTAVPTAWITPSTRSAKPPAKSTSTPGSMVSVCPAGTVICPWTT